MYKELVH